MTTNGFLLDQRAVLSGEPAVSFEERQAIGKSRRHFRVEKREKLFFGDVVAGRGRPKEQLGAHETLRADRPSV